MRELRKDIQIIFQDPYASLNPKMTVRELIQAPLDVFTQDSSAEKLGKVKSILAEVGLGKRRCANIPTSFPGTAAAYVIAEHLFSILNLFSAMSQSPP